MLYSRKWTSYSHEQQYGPAKTEAANAGGQFQLKVNVLQESATENIACMGQVLPVYPEPSQPQNQDPPGWDGFLYFLLCLLSVLAVKCVTCWSCSSFIPPEERTPKGSMIHLKEKITPSEWNQQWSPVSFKVVYDKCWHSNPILHICLYYGSCNKPNEGISWQSSGRTPCSHSRGPGVLPLDFNQKFLIRFITWPWLCARDRGLNANIRLL